MSNTSGEKPSLFAKTKLPQAVVITEKTEMTSSYVFNEEKNFPFVFEARIKLNAPLWIQQNIEEINKKLLKHGAVLLRGFDAKTAEDFALSVEKCGAALPYRERSSPRTAVAGNIYTSTEYPPDQEIFFHNENSYAHRFPRKLYFYCLVEPQTGGATPLADVREVLRFIPNEIIGKFERKGVLYVRNFGAELGLSWREVFQTEDRAEVEQICENGGYKTVWNGENLRTKRIGNAIFTHPQTDEKVWFNHAAFFHVSTHAAEVRDALLAQFAPEDLPHNTFYGDGEPIEPEVLDIVRESYRKASVSFAWCEHDLLIVDNILTAHARATFSGQRKILVAMTD